MNLTLLLYSCSVALTSELSLIAVLCEAISFLIVQRRVTRADCWPKGIAIAKRKNTSDFVAIQYWSVSERWSSKAYFVLEQRLPKLWSFRTILTQNKNGYDGTRKKERNAQSFFVGLFWFNISEFSLHQFCYRTRLFFFFLQAVE